MADATRKSILTLLLIASSQVMSAPVAQDSGSSSSETKLDVPVEQLENLKSGETKHNVESSKPERPATAVPTPVSAVQHAHTPPLAVPSEGVHSVLQDTTVEGPSQPDEHATKVFHGAARLIQAGSGSSNPPLTASRRAFNADINKELLNNVDHFASYQGVQYSPLDMAEYVFWTGDERTVTAAVEEFISEGQMTKEEAILFLQEIKLNLDYLRAHFDQNRGDDVQERPSSRYQPMPVAQRERLRAMMEQAAAKEYPNHEIQSFSFANSPDIIRAISSKNYELNNNLSPFAPLDVREPVKRYDPMLQTNILSTSDYDRDGQIISEEEFSEAMEKLRAADTLFTEYSLEEVIYQLAKMMFSQSLAHEATGARAATQRFMAFLQAEADRGRLSRSVEKRVLDVMVAALTDTIGEHPELLQINDKLGNPANRLIHQFLSGSTAEPSMSRAILAAYKDELLKGYPIMHKLPERK